MKASRERKLTKEKREYWLLAERKVGYYPEHTDRGGKWLIFVPSDAVDEVWQRVKQAAEEGKLGSSAKVSTAKSNPNSTDSSKYVICVYTYDADDEADVQQIRSSLRQLGFTNKIPYKADDTTFQGKYSKSGDKRTSLYYE